MREIKFRVWVEKNKEYADTKKDVYVIGILHNNELKIGYDAPKEELYTGFVLEQFTGLKDKNGKEIYEGDIVKRGDGRTDNMIFADGEFKTENEGWSVDWLVNHRLGDMGEEIEIIGNIHETAPTGEKGD